ncbi:MAG: peptidylprolyl isomerase [Bacteroidetes bacterium]|nr:peptidylprolyl isomerase [Bacteroidota bacterium]
MKNNLFLLAFLLILISATKPVLGQGKVADEVVAVLGGHPVLWSDVETQYQQARMQGVTGDPAAMRCSIFEDLLLQKLMLYQAETDSLVVSDDQVNSELDRRLRYYIQQFGSQEKLEEFYDKSMVEFKAEMKEPLRQELLAQQEQMKIIENIKVTPSEIKAYFKNLPPDSIPIIPTEYEIGQIVKQPPISAEELVNARSKISSLRDRILKGEKFSTLAILYSEDPGSASKGGELGLFGRGTMYPEFEAAAFNLKKKGDVSEIIKTKAGFHVLQLIERKGDFVNVRHILVIPKVSPLDLQVASQKLDSIANLIHNPADSMSFEKAVKLFSDDPGKVNGGMLQNQETGNTRWDADKLDPKVFFTIDKLKVGETSSSVPYTTDDGTQAYRLLYLKVRTEPHRANLKDDYNQIQEWALSKKKGVAVSKWVSEKSGSAYLRINDRYKDCALKYEWNFK